MRDFQIVNGCQTSNVLFNQREHLTENATLMLKIVETSDPAVIDDIVRSTNRQAEVKEAQFLATLTAVKALERYFEVRSAKAEYGLFFERRKNQFDAEDNVTRYRVFEIADIARCFGAMFKDMPDTALRYPNRLTIELSQSIFNEAYCQDLYYVAAYTFYKLRIIISNVPIDKRYKWFRWHLMMAIKYYVCGDVFKNLGSNKLQEECKKIEQFMERMDRAKFLELCDDLCEGLIDISKINRDDLRTITLIQDVKNRALELRGK